MTKEKQIYQNMKHNHRIFKSHGKYGIKYSGLYMAIKEAGYNDRDVINKIIDNMISSGYIRPSKDVWGRTCTDQGLSHHLGNYIILKWEN